ncbi:hypothetical protein [Fructobacillus cardui]|uniref:hypothetical protein n=1 Tax=Fructobacillus cardui TaxID=2893170 RepID=UPI002D927FAC|nr:unnamed protein product [Fructobacillus cardui]
MRITLVTKSGKKKVINDIHAVNETNDFVQVEYKDRDLNEEVQVLIGKSRLSDVITEN